MHLTPQQSSPQAASEELLLLQKQRALLIDDQRTGQYLQQQIRPVTPWQMQGIGLSTALFPRSI